MDIAGGPLWAKWKEERKAAGLPLVDVPKPKPKPQPQPVKLKKPSPPKIEPEPEFVFDRSKTGAAAVLP